MIRKVWIILGFCCDDGDVTAVSLSFLCVVDATGVFTLSAENDLVEDGTTVAPPSVSVHLTDFEADDLLASCVKAWDARVTVSVSLKE